MAGRYDNVDFDNPFASSLFTTGYVNDVTPLDDYNLNLMLTASQQNKNSIDNILIKNQDQDNTLNGHTTTLVNHATKLDELTASIEKCDDTDVLATEPTLTVTLKSTLKGGSTNVTSVERGTEVTFTANLSFEDGAYKYGAKDEEDNLVADEDYCFEYDTNTPGSPVGYQVYHNDGRVYPTGFKGNKIDITQKCEDIGTYTFAIDAKVNNVDTITPLTKLGKKIVNYNYTATPSFTKAVTCYMPASFIVSDSNGTPTNIDSGYLRVGRVNLSYKAGSEYTHSISSGTKCVVIAVPANKGKPKIVDQNSYQDISGSFVLDSSEVTVNDAAGTSYDTNYKVYKYAPPNGWTTGTTIKVTLA